MTFLFPMRDPADRVLCSQGTGGAAVGGIGGTAYGDPSGVGSGANDLGLGTQASIDSTQAGGGFNLSKLLGGGGKSSTGSGGNSQYLSLLSQLMQQHQQGFGGSFVTGGQTQGGRTEPLEFGAKAQVPSQSPGERLLYVMRSLS